MAYLQFLDGTGNGSADAGVSGRRCRRRRRQSQFGVVSVIETQRNHRELQPTPPLTPPPLKLKTTATPQEGTG